MPNVITHGLMAQETLKQLPVSTVRSAIEHFEQAFLFGSNGPDFLFYYNVWPWLNQKEAARISDFGEIIHRQKINEFTDTMVDLAYQLPKGKKQDIALAFIAGYLTHWSLDSVAHPFIFYRSGEMKGSTRYWHYRYESMLDSLMVTRVFELKLQDVPSKKFVKLSKMERETIAWIVSTAVYKVYGTVLTQQEAMTCMKHFYQVLHALFDPKTRLFPVVQWVENHLMRKPWNFSSHMVIGDLDEVHDILNEHREAWCNPTDPSEIHHDSFMQLFDQALGRATLALSQLDHIGMKKAVSMAPVMQNRQFDTGKSEDRPMIIYDSVYEKSGNLAR